MKKVIVVLVICLVVIQFFRPAKNIATQPSAKAITSQHTVPQGVLDMLHSSCYDCHSNNTSYPWYNNIQPVTWWLDNHVKEGKRELNFDEFAGYSPKVARKKLAEIAESVKDGSMPLRSYTLIHRNAVLDKQQQQEIISWADSLRVSIP